MTTQFNTLVDAQPQIGEEPVQNGSQEEEQSIKRDVTRDKTRINFMRRGGNVKRFHTFPIIGEQTNGHHQYNVLSLLLILHPNPSMELVQYVLWHDTAEDIFGDVPATMANYNRELYDGYNQAQDTVLTEVMEYPVDNLSQEDRYWFECLDKLEAYLFAKEQLSLGNQNMTFLTTSVIFLLLRLSCSLANR